jgi:hypothetical protein
VTRIAIVSNWTAPRCGIQSFGEDLAAALRYAGLFVREWDWSMPLWQIVEGMDHVIYNWHPGTSPAIDPPPEPCTVIAHEVPLYSDVVWPDWFRRSQTYVLVGERYEGYAVLRYPMLDYVSPCEPPERGFRLGTTGIRGDGVELLRAAADKAGWEFSCSPTDRFATRQEEIDRLAGCHAVALWYWATGRAQSLALPVVLAARRKTLCTLSTMLDEATVHRGVLRVRWTDDLDTIIASVGAAGYPDPRDETNTWSQAIGALRRFWRAHGIEL